MHVLISDRTFSEGHAQVHSKRLAHSHEFSKFYCLQAFGAHVTMNCTAALQQIGSARNIGNLDRNKHRLEGHIGPK